MVIGHLALHPLAIASVAATPTYLISLTTVVTILPGQLYLATSFLLP